MPKECNPTASVKFLMYDLHNHTRSLIYTSTKVNLITTISLPSFLGRLYFCTSKRNSTSNL